MAKRVFWIVLDSFGMGNAPDAAAFGDAGSNTLKTVAASPAFYAPNLQKLGLFNIEGAAGGDGVQAPGGAFARLVEVSAGKDTTTGHWEMAGVESAQAMPTFPEGFPQSLMEAFEARTGRGTLCNKPYSGTQVIKDYGEEHLRTGKLIVYTSADSVFQIAANEAIVPLPELYRYCEIAREMLAGPLAVGRVIARPFEGTAPDNFRRTGGRHDFSLPPPQPTVLNALADAGHAVIGVGKIFDIFAGSGVTEKVAATNNAEGMARTLEIAGRDFEGLCYVNLVDFDMVYGHRNDIDGYAGAITRFDEALGELLSLLQGEDILILTADHGCDPGTPSTDHSRECVPLLVAGAPVQPGVDLGTRRSFSCIANTVAAYFALPTSYPGDNLWPLIDIKLQNN